MTERSRDQRIASGAVVRLKYKNRGLRVFPGEYVIGRGRNCHVIIDDDLVSRRHACLTYLEPLRLVLRDLDSRNGVFVNWKRVAWSRRRRYFYYRIGGGSRLCRKYGVSP